MGVGLFNIPPEVVWVFSDFINSLSALLVFLSYLTHNAFRYLKQNDLLRLRLVCKKMKNLADDYLQLKVASDTTILSWSPVNQPKPKHPYYYDVLELGDINRIRITTTVELLQSNIPLKISNLQIVNYPAEAYVEDKAWKTMEFLDRFGEQIIHLTMQTFTCPMSDVDIQFYEALPNLKHLTVKTMYFFDGRMGGLAQNYEHKFPNTFQNLESLKVEKYYATGSGSTACKTGFWKMVSHCRQLKTLFHPQYDYVHATVQFANRMTFASYSFRHIEEMFSEGREDFPEKPLLNCYNLYYMMNQTLYDNQVPMEDAIRLLTTCVKQDIKLLKVPGYLIESLVEPEHVDVLRQAAQKNIYSFFGLNFNCVAMEYPLLEALTLETRFASLERPEEHPVAEVMENPWPNLSFLRVRIYASRNKAHLRDIFQYLFARTQRPTLKELSLDFKDIDNTPVPRSMDMIYSCFNLKRLVICNWRGSNRELSILWTGLPLLEDVTLDKCLTLDNSAFIGEETTNPTFLQLKNLKRLSLLSLQMMPKVTDTLLQSVIRNMELREFMITCPFGPGQPAIKLKSITFSGFMSLLTGVFAQTIEKFPADAFQMEGVTEQQQKVLWQKFRSSHL